MARQQSPTIWARLETRWPAIVDGKQVGFAALRQQMQGLLADSLVDVQGFSHFGVVVRNMDTSVGWLSEFVGGEHQKIKKDWVEDYKVYVARTQLKSTELELIGPASFSVKLGDD